ncbi:toxin-antitoxin system HicB family antitoxin [Nocardioides sp. CER19]|uniref:toxin-antitoxin system HicB family antitoxin n=1 Tax=Nocardioides sp. CER19 TaxID=3038538 RepID=UPI002448BA88|nr:toxin-antitoxin system HicB family antitoxin [Nocardioides sp. CER19]MDH2413200.1 toxin-antitoxin system HicB family antitoxin [Nocardioides sp. CER19]
MDITPYVEGLRRDLLAAAEAAGPEARETAERLSYALDPAARLALMEAVSQATSEITAELPAGSVEVRLSGRDLEFRVETPPAPAPPVEAEPTEAEDEGSLARITLRIPESVKARAEEYAARSGASLNTWLVNLVRNATREGAINVDIDLSSIPFLGGPGAAPQGRGPHRMTGWA